MTTTLPRHREMALSRYAYDLGVPLADFLLRLHLCQTTTEAIALIEAGQFRLDGVICRDPALVVHSQLLGNGSVAELLDQRVTLAFWSDDNGLR